MTDRARKLHFDFRSGGRPDPRLETERASAGTHPGGWSFLHDDPVGALIELPADTARIAPGAGLLLENGSANHVRNPRAEGAAAGAPGTAPTHWSLDTGAATAEIVGSGVERGWPYLEVRLTGDPGGAARIWFETETAIAAIPGDDWTISVGARRTGGDLTNITAARLVLQQRDATAALATATGADMALDAAHRRAVLSAGAGESALAHIRPGLELATAGAVDLTVRIYAPQAELSAFATSPVLPPAGAPGAATREADSVRLDAEAWIGRGDVSIVMEFARMGLDHSRGRQNLVSLDDGTFANIINLFVHDSDSCRARLHTNASADMLVGVVWGDVAMRAGAVRLAARLSGQDARIVSSLGQASLGALDLSVLDRVTHLQVGGDPAGRALNGYLAAMSVFPEALSDDALEALAAV